MSSFDFSMSTSVNASYHLQGVIITMCNGAAVRDYLLFASSVDAAPVHYGLRHHYYHFCDIKSIEIASDEATKEILAGMGILTDEDLDRAICSAFSDYRRYSVHLSLSPEGKMNRYLTGFISDGPDDRTFRTEAGAHAYREVNWIVTESEAERIAAELDKTDDR